MQRALNLAERSQADMAAITHRLLDILAEAAPSMPKVAAALTGLPGSSAPADAATKADASSKPAEAKSKPVPGSSPGTMAHDPAKDADPRNKPGEKSFGDLDGVPVRPKRQLRRF